MIDTSASLYPVQPPYIVCQNLDCSPRAGKPRPTSFGTKSPAPSSACFARHSSTVAIVAAAAAAAVADHQVTLTKTQFPRPAEETKRVEKERDMEPMRSDSNTAMGPMGSHESDDSASRDAIC